MLGCCPRHNLLSTGHHKCCRRLSCWSQPAINLLHPAINLLYLRGDLTSFMTVMQENVDMMSCYMDLSRFKAIYVVDLCHSLCEVARKKVAAKGWQNVHVVEGDACRFRPKTGLATLVTFSYSLSSEF